MGRLALLASTTSLVILLVAGRALAERVVLLRPIDDQPELSELFNRLQGELRMQGFDAKVTTTQARVSFEDMQRLAESARAEACIALTMTGGQPTVQLWFIERLSARPQSLAFSGGNDEDAAQVLPLRTVELLRSGVLERKDPEPSRELVVSKPAKSEPPKGAAKSERVAPIEYKRSAQVLVGPSYGTLREYPAPAVFLSLGSRLRGASSAAAYLVVPLSSATHETGRATARFSTIAFGAELRFEHAFARSPVRLQALGGVGGARIYATASATEPLHALRSTGWVASAHVGTAAWIDVHPRWSLGGTLRLGGYLPRPVVQVDARELTLGRPTLEAYFGVATAF
ncbi:MAG: hypothetical protein QM784_26195 [Polyangiaceae bacterium]